MFNVSLVWNGIKKYLGPYCPINEVYVPIGTVACFSDNHNDASQKLHALD